MDRLWQDLRYAVRQLARHKGFTATAVLTLALGIGANTAMFSVVYSVLLRPLPYPAPRQLVGVAEIGQGRRSDMSVTYDQFRFLVNGVRPFRSLSAATPVGFNLFTGNVAERVGALRVSQNYFRTLDVAPAMGRGFAADEDQPGGPNVAVLSDALWQRRFAADRGVIGRAVTLDGQSYTIVGVMPAGFESLLPPNVGSLPVEIWTTLAQVGATIGSGQNLSLIGRLPAGSTLAGARAEFAVTSAAFHREFEPRNLVSKDTHMDLAPYNSLVVESVRVPVRVLFGAIGFVLLIACANLAALMLGRSLDRNRELAVRAALGASRGRVIRQLLTESMLLSLLGGIGGLLLAAWGMSGLVRFVPSDLPHATGIRLDWIVLLFTVVLSVGTGLLFGLAPAWITSAARPQGTLRESGARTTGSVRTVRLRDGIVIAEIALSLILIAGAGLMIRTFANLLRTDPGFDPNHVASAEIWLAGTRYTSTSSVSAYYGELTRRLDASPGVRSAAVVEAGEPLERGANLGATFDGKVLPAVVWYRTVTPDYFRTIATPVRSGRTFGPGDTGESQPVAVVNSAFARASGISGDVLGHQVRLGGSSNPVARIVGVVGDVRSFVGAPAEPTVYVPSSQTPIGFTRVFGGWFPIHVLVRTSGDPAGFLPTLREAIQATDPSVPVGRIRSMNGVLNSSLAFQRFLALLLALFAGLGLVLAVVGVYGLLAYLVAQRARDIGVRMALGARPAQMVRMILRRGAVLAGIGCLAGMGGAAALTRLLAHELFDVTPTDPAAFAAGALIISAAVLVAGCIPARRAARVDPIVSLRSE